MYHTHLPAYEDGTVCSETSAYKIQTPGNYPEEIIQHSEHGEISKSIIYTSSFIYSLKYSFPHLPPSPLFPFIFLSHIQDSLRRPINCTPLVHNFPPLYRLPRFQSAINQVSFTLSYPHVAQSVKRLATGWTVQGSNPSGGEIFRTRPDRS